MSQIKTVCLVRPSPLDPAYSRSSYLPRVNANKLRGGPYPEDNGLCVVSSREPSPSPDTSRPDLRIDETSSRLEARVCGETLMTTPLLPPRGTRATYLLPTTTPPAHGNPIRNVCPRPKGWRCAHRVEKRRPGRRPVACRPNATVGSTTVLHGWPFCRFVVSCGIDPARCGPTLDERAHAPAVAPPDRGDPRSRVCITPAS